MSSSNPSNELGKVLVDFSEHGAYPEDETASATFVSDSILPAALEVLRSAKEDLESEIKQISRKSAPDVDDWIIHAKAIQHDIQESKKLANSIARQAQEDEQRLEALQEQESYAQFLAREVDFQEQLLVSLNAVWTVHTMLNEAEDLATRSQFTEALHKLDAAGKAFTRIPMDKTARAMQILETKNTEIRELIHQQVLAIWNSLVFFDMEEGSLTIHQSRPDVTMDIPMAMKGLETFSELREAAQKLSDDINLVIIGPRTNVGYGSTPSILVKDNSIYLHGTTDRTLKPLFRDLQNVIEFLNKSLPADLVSILASIMMPPLSKRILETWLDSAVPASLDDMVDYQKALALVFEFAYRLDVLKWPSSEVFHDWVTNAPKIWLNKRRETALDWTRNQISLGIGPPVLAERVEKQIVAREEADELAAATAGSAVTQEWDSAWDSENEIDDVPVLNGERNRLDLEEERRAAEISPTHKPPVTEDEDDAADAWGWGDDEDGDVDADIDTDGNVEMKAEPARAPTTMALPATRQMILSEKYWISSIPQPVFNTIKKLYNDGARLTQPETNEVPISAAAPGLFSLPTLVLAMYRAVSPSYYANQPGGNMFLYNDAMWLSEAFDSFLTEWNSRTDLTPRAYGMVKLESEIKVLTSFGKRAYTNELVEQRIIINDLFGGTQNFFQQDVSPGNSSLNDSIDSVIQHVRNQAAIWKKILSYSAWASATGSLVNTIATRIITDVFDLSDISVDEAERIATVIARVQEMDDMFMKDGVNTSDGKQIPMTPRFADKWLKMQFLSEFLQSNLVDVKFLWLESDLSLYFTLEEVVELIGLSFEKNQAVRAAIREISEKPFPKAS